MKHLSRRAWMAGAAGVYFSGALAAQTQQGQDADVKGGTAPDSLNGAARAKGLAFGSALGTQLKPPPGMPALQPFRARSDSYSDPKMRALFVEQCGMLVPENELKWYVLRPDPKTFDFRRADILVDFATRHQLAVRGHTLLWNRSRWTPPWLLKHDFGRAPMTAAENMLRDHIARICKRYGQRIFSYDVVNETIAPGTGEFEDSPFTKVLGPEVVDICFHAAREHAPHAELVYNDYMSWGKNDAKHRAGVLKLLERLKKNNVPVHALGIQAHIGSDAMGAATGPLADVDETGWRKFLDEVSGMGLDLMITEFDVNDRTVEGDIATRDRVVADYGKAYLDLALSYPRMRYVMAWGIVDKYSWLQRITPRADGLPKRCTPYDENFQPKPLRDAMMQAFAAAPARPPIDAKPA